MKDNIVKKNYQGNKNYIHTRHGDLVHESSDRAAVAETEKEIDWI